MKARHSSKVPAHRRLRSIPPIGPPSLVKYDSPLLSPKGRSEHIPKTPSCHITRGIRQIASRVIYSSRLCVPKCALASTRRPSSSLRCSSLRYRFLESSERRYEGRSQDVTMRSSRWYMIEEETSRSREHLHWEIYLGPEMRRVSILHRAFILALV